MPLCGLLRYRVCAVHCIGCLLGVMIDASSFVSTEDVWLILLATEGEHLPFDLDLPCESR